MKLTIKRNKWFRGSSIGSALLCRDGKMCCLGFLACEVGAEPGDIQDIGNPYETSHLSWPDGVLDKTSGSFHNNSKLINDVIHINDDPGLLDSERERLLTAKFQLIGIDVQFVD